MTERPELSDVEHAIWFIQTYCPHWPIVGLDWQTLDGTMKEYRLEAERCYELLDSHGMIQLAARPPKAKPWRSGKPNFRIIQQPSEDVCHQCGRPK